MSEQGNPKFLDVKSYRRKRWIDAARILPLVGAIGILMPLPFLFLAADDAPPALPLAIYFFVFWLALILAAFVMSYRLPREDDVTDG